MWNIEGTAESVYQEMMEEEAREDELDYFLRNAYFSVYSRDIDVADKVIAEIKTNY
jgi:hypothetical protein